MAADRETRKRLRRAYAEAWHERTPSGDDEHVLLERLRAHGVDEALDETSTIHQHVVDLWRRGVPPSHVTRETWQLVGRGALNTVATFQLILNQFRETSDEDRAGARERERLDDMPEGKRGVVSHFQDPPSLLLTFEVAASATPLLREYAALASGLLGWARAPVWLDMHADQPRASVMLGERPVGEARVPPGIWRSMTAAAREGVHADGTLEVRVKGDAVETGTLLCSYVGDPPGPTLGEWFADE